MSGLEGFLVSVGLGGEVLAKMRPPFAVTGAELCKVSSGGQPRSKTVDPRKVVGVEVIRADMVVNQDLIRWDG